MTQPLVMMGDLVKINVLAPNYGQVGRLGQPDHSRAHAYPVYFDNDRDPVWYKRHEFVKYDTPAGG